MLFSGQFLAGNKSKGFRVIRFFLSEALWVSLIDHDLDFLVWRYKNIRKTVEVLNPSRIYHGRMYIWYTLKYCDS